MLEDRPPRDGGLVRVGRPDDIEAGNRAQCREVLDRLVGRTVFAQPDRVVRPDVGDRQLHEGRQPNRAAHVVAERQEGAAVGAGAAVQGDAVEDRAHRMFANAEVQHPTVRAAGKRLGLPVFGQE